MAQARFSIAAMMGAVLVAALGLAVLRYGPKVSAGVLFLLTCGVLCLGIVGTVCRRGAGRAWWLGFTLFGWGYMTLAFRFVEHLKFQGNCRRPPCSWHSARGLGSPLGYVGSRTAGLDPSYAWAGHCGWTLLAAMIGGILAWTLFGGPALIPIIDCRVHRRARSHEVGGDAGGHRAVGVRPRRDGRGRWRMVGSGALGGLDLPADVGALGFAALVRPRRPGEVSANLAGRRPLRAGYMVLTFGCSPDRLHGPASPPTTS